MQQTVTVSTIKTRLNKVKSESDYLNIDIFLILSLLMRNFQLKSFHMIQNYLFNLFNEFGLTTIIV